jgi:hypothetical protein
VADNVEDVLEQQRAFVADVSHQLRNPSPRWHSGGLPSSQRTSLLGHSWKRGVWVWVASMDRSAFNDVEAMPRRASV